MIGKLFGAEEKFRTAERAHSVKSSELENKLRDKANKAGTGIKHNKTFGDANYNLPKIKTDIAKVTKDSYTPLSNEQIANYHDLLKEEPKQEIEESSPLNLRYSDIVYSSKEFIEKRFKYLNLFKNY